MRYFRFSLLCCLVLFALPAAAQPPTWEIHLYDGLQIHTLTPDGIIRSIDAPSGAQGMSYPAGVSNNYFSHIRLSPDHRYLVFADTHMPDDMAHTASLQIADLAEGTCCFALPTPFPGHADTILVGPFSPDGTQVAAIITRQYGDWASTIVTIDLASQAISAQLSPLEKAAINNIGVFFGGWDDVGIQLLPTCYACDGGTSGAYLNWQPATGELTPTDVYFHPAGDTLPTTNEHIRPAANPDYPQSDEPGIGLWSNVIEYIPSGGAPEVLFHDSTNLQLGDVHWVIDGQAYLLYPTVIFRNGTQLPVASPIQGEFIVGTPDGWVMQSRNNLDYRADTELYYYHFRGGVLSVTELGLFPRRVAVLDAPALGTTAPAEITPVIR